MLLFYCVFKLVGSDFNSIFFRCSFFIFQRTRKVPKSNDFLSSTYMAINLRAFVYFYFKIQQNNKNNFFSLVLWSDSWTIWRAIYITFICYFFSMITQVIRGIKNRRLRLSVPSFYLICSTMILKNRCTAIPFLLV